MSHTRPVPGLPGYEADRSGNIYSVSHNWRGGGKRRMAAHADRYGYLRVRLTVHGERRRHRVHCLVLKAFVGERPSPNHDARHLDGNRQNNRLFNLAWGTRRDNARDRERHGNTSRGASHSRAIRKGLRAALARAEGDSE